ncbi:hypothetical protein LV89_02017 [Arcicella aurantiaca]|uniref:Uncharacterized protein n=1 Tax=Arcicella aurantiaca TaxID=591202 RepID=A0A316EAP4_9BACT|nr:hypothetical protein [Arcicella aurantiaca]PWK27202.1 hypothetical protein LV89_02017 [Arcicella aurantiaca]
MTIIDTQINTYVANMVKCLPHLLGLSKRAAYIELRVYAVGIIRLIDFHLGRDNSGIKIPIEPIIEPKNNGSLSSQNHEITAQSHIIGSCVVCGASLKGKRKGAVFCSKECNNSNRKNHAITSNI